MKHLVMVAFAYTVISAASCAMAFTGRVVAVSDGDTITVLHAETNQAVKVRLYGIDAPEKNQNFGAQSARLTKELFLRHGFRIVYDKDQDEAVSDGFFYTVGYGDLTSSELLSELLLYGICAISLTTTGSRQPGIRVCVSQLNRPEQFDLLEARLTAFGQNHR